MHGDIQRFQSKVEIERLCQIVGMLHEHAAASCYVSRLLLRKLPLQDIRAGRTLLIEPLLRLQRSNFSRKLLVILGQTIQDSSHIP